MANEISTLIDQDGTSVDKYTALQLELIQTKMKLVQLEEDVKIRAQMSEIAKQIKRVKMMTNIEKEHDVIKSEAMKLVKVLNNLTDELHNTDIDENSKKDMIASQITQQLKLIYQKRQKCEDIFQQNSQETIKSLCVKMKSLQQLALSLEQIVKNQNTELKKLLEQKKAREQEIDLLKKSYIIQLKVKAQHQETERKNIETKLKIVEQIKNVTMGKENECKQERQKLSLKLLDITFKYIDVKKKLSQIEEERSHNETKLKIAEQLRMLNCSVG